MGTYTKHNIMLLLWFAHFAQGKAEQTTSEHNINNVQVSSLEYTYPYL